MGEFLLRGQDIFNMDGLGVVGPEPLWHRMVEHDLGYRWTWLDQRPAHTHNKVRLSIDTLDRCYNA